MPHHHADPSASALAHGPTKPEAIELTRLAVDRANRIATRRMQEQAARRERELIGRSSSPGDDRRSAFSRYSAARSHQ